MINRTPSDQARDSRDRMWITDPVPSPRTGQDNCRSLGLFSQVRAVSRPVPMIRTVRTGQHLSPVLSQRERTGVRTAELLITGQDHFNIDSALVTCHHRPVRVSAMPIDFDPSQGERTGPAWDRIMETLGDGHWHRWSEVVDTVVPGSRCLPKTISNLIHTGVAAGKLQRKGRYSQRAYRNTRSIRKV
jgi:hypothetical protein